jgi:hypothetical protein
MDGDPKDTEDNRPDAEIDDPVGPRADDGGLDDTTGEDDPLDAADLDLDEDDPAWIGEPQDAGDLDLGGDDGLEIRDESSSFVGAEEAGTPGVDFGLDDVPEVTGLDSGEEGPIDADEELREADLPSLDADDDGDEGDSGPTLDDSFLTEPSAGLPWAERPLQRVGAPVALVSATAVACVARGAVVAGKTESGNCELLRVDLEGGSQTLPALGMHGSEVGALAAEDGVLAVVLGDGRLLLSRDGGMRFEAPAEGLGATDAVLVSGALWVRTASRGIAVSISGGPLQRRSVGGAVAAICADGESGMVALAVDAAGVPTALLRGLPDGSLESQSLAAPVASGRAIVAARGPFVAYSSRRGVLRRGADGAWHAYEWEGQVTSLVFVGGDGGLIAATYSDADDTTALVHLAESGKATVVARLGPSTTDGDLDGRTSSVAFDDARGVLWVAGGFGVTAFAVR